VTTTDTLPPGALPPHGRGPDGEDPADAKTIRSDRAPGATDAPAEEPPLPPGTTLDGRYVLGAELGRGGMGIVYRARDESLGRLVALKVLQRRLRDDAELHARFVDEARVTAQLQHPAIVPVFDVGATPDGLVYYTMRLVEGRTLADLSKVPWTLEPRGTEGWSLFRALDAFAQACRAVAYAHDRGVVHRDLKPSNVMVGRWGEVHVLDWGLATTVGWRPPSPPPLPPRDAPPPDEPGDAPIDAVPAKTRTGTILGTPAYMAPEQARGEALDARADVYALGGVLYTLLAGRLPREGATSQVLWRLTWGVPPDPPSGHRPDVPPALEALCLRALADRREERPPSAAELGRAVEAYLDGRPTGPVAPEDAEFLRSYDPGAHRRPSVTVDVVVLHAPPGATPRVLLHRRSRSPFKGRWALPGSFVRLEDDLETAARRTLWREAGLGAPDLRLAQLGAFGAPERDPRTRVITVAWLCVLDAPAPPEITTPPDEADVIGWFEATADGPLGVRLRAIDPAHAQSEGDGPQPAFDHGEIVAAALRSIAAHA
jgi:serine/threonine protein kinase